MGCNRRSPAAFGRFVALVCLLALTAGACSSGGGEPTATAETRPRAKAASKKKGGQGGTSTRKDKVFRLSAGTVTLRRVGFDTLRISNVATKARWRSHIDDNNDDSVAVEFWRGRRTVDFGADFDNGRLTVEACEDFTQLGTVIGGGDAGKVTVRPLPDEELSIARVTARRGWRGRIVDNNSEDVGVVFTSKGRTVEVDAQLDDGRIEGTICELLS